MKRSVAGVARVAGIGAIGTLLALYALSLPSNAPAAQADTCTGHWSAAVGGMTPSIEQTSAYLQADQLVTHNSLNPTDGYEQLDAVVQRHIEICPADHIEIIGHSEGAAVVDAWAADHLNEVRMNIVLLALPGGVPKTQGMPVLNICRENDYVCNPGGTDVSGYLFENAHTSYDYSAYDYDDSATGSVWLPST